MGGGVNASKRDRLKKTYYGFVTLFLFSDLLSNLSLRSTPSLPSYPNGKLLEASRGAAPSFCEFYIV